MPAPVPPNQDVGAGVDGRPQHVDESRRHGSIVTRSLIFSGSTANRRIDSTGPSSASGGMMALIQAVRQAGVDHEGRFVDPTAHGRYDAVDDLHEMGVVAEDRVRPLELAATLW